MILLQTAINSFFSREHLFPAWHYTLMRSWNIIIGTIADKMYLKKIEGSILHVGIHDVHWMHQLHMLSSTIIDTINNFLKNRYITALKLSHSHKNNRKVRARALSTTENTTKQSSMRLPSTHNDALARIHDHVLRGYLHDLFYRCHDIT